MNVQIIMLLTRLFSKKSRPVSNFWAEIRRSNPGGLFVLAPMADVTDNPFRRILSEIGPPTVYWNEFVAADGLAHPVARTHLEKMLHFEKNQRPIVAQIFSSRPDSCRRAAMICTKHGFNAIDINMGCPQRNILKQTCGAELCKLENRELVRNIIIATREGSGSMPVSVKTRIGYNQIDLSWIEFLLQLHLPLLTVHLRTKKEMSKVPAHWELMTQIREMRDRISPETVLIGNGDVNSREQGKQLITEYGIDGVMVGRGLFSDPWFFSTDDEKGKTIQERIDLAIRHTQYYVDEYTEQGILVKNFNLMKKFYKVYINGFPGAKELRVELMSAENSHDVQSICDRFLSKIE